MMNDKKLTEFQSNLAPKVDDLLVSKGVQFTKEVQGETENYIYYECKKENLRIWIYENEAEYKVSDLQRLYEWQSYDNESDLKKDFLISLKRTMKQKYLVVHDYGTGGIWYYIIARSKEEIESKFPGFEVIEEEPAWLDEKTKQTLEIHDIDDEPVDDYLKSMMKKKD